jgi:hypothetical protein
MMGRGLTSVKCRRLWMGYKPGGWFIWVIWVCMGGHKCAGLGLWICKWEPVNVCMGQLPNTQPYLVGGWCLSEGRDYRL